jgi:hypothetical protein
MRALFMVCGWLLRSASLSCGPHGTGWGSARISCAGRAQLLAMSCWRPKQQQLLLQRADVLGPAWGLAAWGTWCMAGMLHHARLQLHPEAPYSLLGLLAFGKARGGPAGTRDAQPTP